MAAPGRLISNKSPLRRQRERAAEHNSEREIMKATRRRLRLAAPLCLPSLPACVGRPVSPNCSLPRPTAFRRPLTTRPVLGRRRRVAAVVHFLFVDISHSLTFANVHQYPANATFRQRPPTFTDVRQRRPTCDIAVSPLSRLDLTSAPCYVCVPASFWTEMRRHLVAADAPTGQAPAAPLQAY